jgi:serine/threonine protein phosphatase PrpC
MVSLIFTNMNSFIKQASAKQDFTFYGQSDDKKFDYIGVADAHGKLLNALYPTTILKKLNFSIDLQNEDFFEKIMEKTNIEESNGVGSTLCICRVFPDKFEFSWVGDSTGKLYKEGTCIWQTKDHDGFNKDEQKRLEADDDVCIKTKDPLGEQIFDIKVKNPTTIKMVHAKVYHFLYNNHISFTHSLGHSGLTGSHISKEIIPREPGVSYKAICATDGLWAMVCEDDHELIGNPKVSSEEIVKFADERWHQSWKQEYNGQIINNDVKFPKSNIDDIGVSVWSC